MNKVNSQGKWGQAHRWRAEDSHGAGEGVEGLSKREKDSWIWTGMW